jgi:hypothetical protein
MNWRTFNVIPLLPGREDRVAVWPAVVDAWPALGRRANA